MSGETNLDTLIRNMKPSRQEGDYVFCSVTDLHGIDRADTLCEFREKEGVTLVLEQATADALHLDYDYIASWITLEVHSSLDAVGLTAAVSKVLAHHAISCNVIAGYYHDHIFVNRNDVGKALQVLQQLSRAGQ